MNASISTAPSVGSQRILFGWKQIANFLNAGVRTAQRYERLHGLPVRRPAGKPKAAVMTTVTELEAWVAARPLATALRSEFVAPPVVLQEFRSAMETMRRLRVEMVLRRKELKVAVKVLQSNIPIDAASLRFAPTGLPDRESRKLN